MDQWPDLSGRAQHGAQDRPRQSVPRRTAPRPSWGTVFIQVHARTGEQSL